MGPSTRPKIEYVLFDVDGLMIDSERIYTEVTSAYKILKPYGKTMTWDIKAGCMGKPQMEATKYLLSFFPDVDISIEDYLKQRNELQDKMWPTVSLLPGVARLVKHLKAHNIPIAVATGSRRSKYLLKINHLSDVFDCFGENVVCGDDQERFTFELRGKPEPDIFLAAAGVTLHRDVGLPGVYPTPGQVTERARGLVFEDGLSGMQAAKRAGMSVVWVPDPNLKDVTDKDYTGTEQPDRILQSLEDFKPEEWGLPPYSEA
ncbi:HAD-like protein [Fistulina hepatica ATCC 64428]|uniref:HAD-like protein n=1 Tax=Fistulina hepatica ATCC 64428 TaxID=1128425 RepID=A0A0D7A178_9AGAR|nr:HAD-like protein [Fistulina hepatica ATCC 64428]